MWIYIKMSKKDMTKDKQHLIVQNQCTEFVVHILISTNKEHNYLEISTNFWLYENFRKSCLALNTILKFKKNYIEHKEGEIYKNKCF